MASGQGDRGSLVAFGRAVRARRRALGLSQEQLAHRAGLSRSYVTEIETGNRNVALLNIVKLAQALGVSPAALLTGMGSTSDENADHKP